jgi:ABC-type transport system involved in multi-copper enzyme maturation permease subunit
MKTLTLFYIQLSSRFRTILVWIAIWTLLSCLFASVFNDLSKTAADSIKLYQSLPPAVLHTFNISADYLTQVEKFLSGQFLSVYMLAGSIFSVFLGVSAIGGKIEDATIANLLTKSFSRVRIYVTQAATNIALLLVASIGTGLSMFTIFKLISNQENISTHYFISTFTGTAILFITLALLGQLLGMVIGKAHGQAAGSALVVMSFFVNGLGALAGVPSWLQKCSVFYYFNTIELRDLYSLDWMRLLVLITGSLLLLLAGSILFRRKDLYL